MNFARPGSGCSHATKLILLPDPAIQSLRLVGQEEQCADVRARITAQLRVIHSDDCSGVPEDILGELRAQRGKRSTEGFPGAFISKATVAFGTTVEAETREPVSAHVGERTLVCGQVPILVSPGIRVETLDLERRRKIMRNVAGKV